MPIDFKKLNQILLQDARSLLPAILSNGRFIGNEFVVGDLQNKPGDSLRFNITKGCGKDFATGETFGDVIDLYAKAKGLSQLEAARQLADRARYDVATESISSSPTLPPPPELKPEPPPEGEVCDCVHPIHGQPTKTWEYRTREGRLMFYIARYDTEDGKQIVPWSWIECAWKMKGWPTPRPLYGLDTLVDNKPVLIVEGEKAADAAREKLGKIYNVLTWPNGALAYTRADWSHLKGWGRVLLWEDADQPGREAMQGVAKILSDLGVNEIKWIDTAMVQDLPDGWDAADANMDAKNLLGYLKPLAKIYKSPMTVYVKAETVNAEKAIVQVNNYSSDDTQIADTPESSAYWIDKLGLAVSKKGRQVFNDMENGVRIVSRHPKYEGRIAFDTFYNRLQIRNDDGTYRFMDDEDLHLVLEFVQGSLGLRKYSIEDVLKATKTVGWKNKKNEPKDWMESLVWDGTPRVAGFFRDYYVAEDNDYSKAVSTNFWVGMVARIFDPGCKLDNMVILEGPQGIFKSKSLEAIGGIWYSGADGSPDNKDFFLNLRGKMLVEISELDSFRKVEDTLVKKLLSQRFDRYRDPYGMTPKDNFRTCVFVGTTNEQEYLKDHTGARRFWPVRCGRINLAAIERDRVQLFAEAVHLYKQGATWWAVPEQEAKSEQDCRRASDVWEEPIQEYLIGKTETTMHDIGINCLKIELNRFDSGIQRRIGKILRSQGWENVQKRIGGSRSPLHVWRKKFEDCF